MEKNNFVLKSEPSKESWIEKVKIAKTARSPEELEDIAKLSEHVAVLMAVVQNPNATEEIIESIFEKTANNSYFNGYVFTAIAGSSKCSPEIFEKLAQLDDIRVGIALAKNPNATSKALDILIEKNQPVLDVAAAENPNLSKEAIDKIIERGFSWALYHLTKNKNLTTEQLDKMAELPYETVIREVLKNEKTSEAAKQKVAQKLAEMDLKDLSYTEIELMQKYTNPNDTITSWLKK
ncbi:MAG: hypothetical protein ACP5RP_02635 [Candidatus Micrarchaeia archaeon]